MPTKKLTVNGNLEVTGNTIVSNRTLVINMRDGSGTNALEQIPDKEVIKQTNNPNIPEAEMQVGAFGVESSMFGGPHLVTSKRGMAVGGYNYVNGQNGFGAGEANTASGRCSATFGGHNEAFGNSSFAHGADNTAEGDNSHVEGNGNKIKKTKTSSSAPSGKDDIRFVISGTLDLNAVNDTTTLSVSTYNARTNQQITLTGLVWSSSNGTILEVTSQTDSSAVITALATGSANIQVQYDGDSSYNAGSDWVSIYVATPRPVSEAAGRNCHAEGEEVEVFGKGCHGEGRYTKAYSEVCHAEGLNTQAGDIQVYSSSGGTTTYSYKQIYGAHAEGIDTVAKGDGSHAGGKGTIADKDYSTAVGKYNIATKTSGALFAVGKGTSDSDRSDAFIIKADGDVQVGAMGSNNLSIATKQYVDTNKGMSNPMTAQGDIIIGGSSGSPSRLGKGYAYQVLRMNSGGTTLEWGSPLRYASDDINGFDIGNANAVNGNHSCAVGRNNTVTSYRSFAQGDGNVVSPTSGDFADSSIASGWNNTVQGSASQAFGFSNKVTSSYSCAIGEGINVTANNCMAVGKYNSTSNQLFVVGKGTSNKNPSDAFIVKSDGDVQVSYTTPSNNTSVATKKYVDDNITPSTGLSLLKGDTIDSSNFIINNGAHLYHINVTCDSKEIEFDYCTNSASITDQASFIADVKSRLQNTNKKYPLFKNNVINKTDTDRFLVMSMEYNDGTYSSDVRIKYWTLEWPTPSERYLAQASSDTDWSNFSILYKAY